MNILYILGNGFDKAQGLATSYQDFYAEYKKIKPKSELESRLIKDIQSDYSTWADLEEGLGKYSNSFTDPGVFREILWTLNGRLKEYLKLQVLRIDLLNLSKDRLINDLLNPQAELEPKQKIELNSYITQLEAGNVFINCVTFNYTDTFEKILNQKDSFIGYLNSKQHPVYFNNLLHIHGNLDDLIILGVNDVSQIMNESFRNIPELIEEFVKPEVNNGCENMKNETFSRYIREADIIVLFGVSVGITDSIWWQIIGERLDNPKDILRVVYYPYDIEKNTELYPYRKMRWANEYISLLKDRMKAVASVDDLRKRVYIGLNKLYFNLK